MTDQVFMIWSGQAMLVGLILTLLARPLQKYTKIKHLMKYRKQLGWATGAAATFHLGYWLFNYFSITVLMTSITAGWFQAGLVAMTIILAMTATSNMWAMRKLKARWKKLHKLVYWAVPLALYHSLFAIRGIDPTWFLWAIPFLLLMGWRLQVLQGAVMLSALFVFLFFNTGGEIIVEPIDEDDIEFVCPREHPESVSCGWPVYLEDGTRIDEPL